LLGGDLLKPAIAVDAVSATSLLTISPPSVCTPWMRPPSRRTTQPEAGGKSMKLVAREHVVGGVNGGLPVALQSASAAAL
jgi:hypothetical protein